MYTVQTMEFIKENITDNVGKTVSVQKVRGRKKAEARKGVITNAYNNLFTIKTDENDTLVCYSYVDVLTKVIIVNLA